jgi:catechol O-methyltransferase
MDTHRPTENGVRVFHEGVEERLLTYVQSHAAAGNPSSVLSAIDEFCMSQHWMMHIGNEKAEVIVSAIREARERYYSHPSSAKHFNVVELGSYCGYSAVRIASELDITKNERLFCLEIDANCVNWTRRMVEYAGLSDKITVIHSPVSNIANWKSHIASTLDNEHFHINILFVDHEKSQYYTDVKLIVDHGLLTSGSTVIADNVLSFNTPKQDYLDYVRDSNGPFQSSKCVEGYIEFSTEEERKQQGDYMKDGIEISVFR